MPNRTLKPSICISETINSLSWFEEVLFYRLIVNCDDYGRFDGRVAAIKNRLFPLKEDLTLRTVKSAIQKLVSVGLVTTYESMGKPYLYLPTWTAHQTVRAKNSKYPPPESENTASAVDVKSSENICKQMQADTHILDYSDCTTPKISKIAQNALPAFEQPVSIPTQLDFQRFSEIAATVYPKGCQYTLEQCLEVFRCYFQTYEDYIGRPHPHIRREQITRIMKAMPCIVMKDRGENLEPLDPEDYTDLIDLHFQTQYQHCDYNINHFFSGRIREILLYGAENGYE